MLASSMVLPPLVWPSESILGGCGLAVVERSRGVA
jgi:hypothetical protein